MNTLTDLITVLQEMRDQCLGDDIKIILISKFMMIDEDNI